MRRRLTEAAVRPRAGGMEMGSRKIGRTVGGVDGAGWEWELSAQEGVEGSSLWEQSAGFSLRESRFEALPLFLPLHSSSIVVGEEIQLVL